MLSFDQALAVILGAVEPLPAETVALAQAHGRVLAEPPLARWNLPAEDRSTMDGYACQGAGRQAGERLALAGAVYAGHLRTDAVGLTEVVRIMTGGVLPPGCDTVVPQEDAVVDGADVIFSTLPRSGQYVRLTGEEITAGAPLLAAGCRLRAGAVGLLAAGGVSQVRVHRRPRVAVLSTGDELVPAGSEPGPGQLVNSSQLLLCARLQELGAEPLPLGIAADDRQQLSAALGQATAAEVLLTTGGVSVGERDLVQEVLQQLGFHRHFWKVAVRPGKPLLFGHLGATAVFGLPGNPGSTATAFELFVVPALRRLAGYADPSLPRLAAVLAAPVRAGGQRLSFLPGRLRWRDGDYHFTAFDRSNSGQHRGYAESRVLLPLPAGVELAAGSRVELVLLDLPELAEPGLFQSQGEGA